MERQTTKERERKKGRERGDKRVTGGEGQCGVQAMVIAIAIEIATAM